MKNSKKRSRKKRNIVIITKTKQKTQTITTIKVTTTKKTTQEDLNIDSPQTIENVIPRVNSIKKKTHILNLTPHEVILRPYGVNGPKYVFPTSNIIARVGGLKTRREYINNEIPILFRDRSDCEIINENEWPPAEGILYIVSSVVFNATTRNDLITPDLTGLHKVVDGEGNLLGCRRFTGRS